MNLSLSFYIRKSLDRSTCSFTMFMGISDAAQTISAPEEILIIHAINIDGLHLDSHKAPRSSLHVTSAPFTFFLG